MLFSSMTFVFMFLPISLDCKRFDFEWVCLIEQNMNHEDTSAQDTNDLTNED